MGKLAPVLLALAACGNDARSADPTTDPTTAAAAAAPTRGPSPATAVPQAPPEADDDPATACRELAAPLARMQALVDDAERIPRDGKLYLLAAQLSAARRAIDVADHELALLDAELAAPDFALRPERYQTLRREERERVAAERDAQLAAEAAMRDEAARSTYPKVAAPDGPLAVLTSIRWRDAAGHVRRYQGDCARDQPAIDVAGLRDFASAMAMLEQDTHDVGSRSIEHRLLRGDDLAGRLP